MTVDAGAAIPVGDGVWAPHRRRLTTGLVLTITLVAFESLAISTVMPVVSDDLGGLGLYGWVFSGFFLGNLLGIVVAGRSADTRGTAFPFAVGLLLFSVGLLVGGLAPSMPVLVAARVAQGIGAGAIPAVAYTSVGRAYPQVLRPRVFAVFSSAWVVPGLIGPAASGAIEHALSWRAVFLALLPFVALAGAMTLPQLSRRPPTLPDVAGTPGTAAPVEGLVPGERPPAAAALGLEPPTSSDAARAPVEGLVLGERPPAPEAVGAEAATLPSSSLDAPDPGGVVVSGAAPDPGGVVVSGAARDPGGVAVPVAAAAGSGADGLPPGGAGPGRGRVGAVDERLLALVLVAGVTAVLVAAGGAPPLVAVPLAGVGVPVAVAAFLRLVPAGTARLAAGMPAAVMVRGILTFAFFGTDAYVSLTFQEVRGQETWVAGLALTGATMMWTVGAWTQERLVHTWGPRRLVSVGFVLVAIGVVGMLGAQDLLPVPAAIAVWSLAGLGTGLSYSPLSVTVLGLAEPGREGAASAGLQLSDVLGVSLGTGAGGAFVALGEGRGWWTGSALLVAFSLTLVVAVVGVLAARRLPATLPT